MTLFGRRRISSENDCGIYAYSFGYDRKRWFFLKRPNAVCYARNATVPQTCLSHETENEKRSLLRYRTFANYSSVILPTCPRGIVSIGSAVPRGKRKVNRQVAIVSNFVTI